MTHASTDGPILNGFRHRIICPLRICAWIVASQFCCWFVKCPIFMVGAVANIYNLEGVSMKVNRVWCVGKYPTENHPNGFEVASFRIIFLKTA